MKLRGWTALALLVLAGACGRGVDVREQGALSVETPSPDTSTYVPSFDVQDTDPSGPAPSTSSSVTSPLPPPTQPAQVAPSGRWIPIPAGPLATRGEPKAVWTGREVVVVGGLLIDQYRALSDGAAFDPAAGTWRRIPDRPVKGRVMAAVWTGEEMVTLGTDGIDLEPLTSAAAFNPATNKWRSMPLPPSTKTPHALAWTGRRVLAWQPSSDPPGAQYDPATNEWTPLPRLSLPGAISSGAAVWTGRELAVEGSLTPDNGGPADQRLLLLDPVAGTWRASPPLPGPLSMWPFLPSVWSGREVILTSDSGSGPRTYAYNPQANRWRTIDNPDTSVAPAYFRGEGLDDGRTAVRVGNPDHPLQLLDPGSGRWIASTRPPGAVPTPDSAMVSIGRLIFHWGIATDGLLVQPRSPNAAWLWDPDRVE